MGEDPVVVSRVGAQPLLDAGELRLCHAAPCQYEGLQCAGKASVAVPEGVDHHQVEVRHRSLHQGVILRRRDRLDEFLHQGRHVDCIRALVDDLILGFVVDEDGSGPVAAG